MDVKNKYSVYLGTSRGTLCYTNVDLKNKVQYEFAKKASEVSSLIWGREHEIITGFKNGLIQMYDTQYQKYLNTVDCLENNGSIVGLGIIDSKILAASNKGKLSVLDSNIEVDSINTINSDESSVDFCIQNMNKPNIFATGGEMNDLKLWDIQTKQCIFKAKSLGHDKLNLPIRTSIRGITFIPEEQNVCCCATKEGHILLYDDRTQRRPIVKYFESKASFTTLATAYRQRNILAGTTKGYIQYVDMKLGKCLKTFTGIEGSVTSLLCDPIEPIIFASSLDRHLRVLNLDTKEILHKQYLKQNLTKMLMKPVVKTEIVEPVDSNESLELVDEEYENLFNNMEVVSEKVLRKRKSNNIIKTKNKKLK